MGLSKNQLLDPWNPKWLRSAILKIEDMIIRFDTMHELDRQTDGQTDSARRHRPLLCIALRRKNNRNIDKMNMHCLLWLKHVCDKFAVVGVKRRCAGLSVWTRKCLQRVNSRQCKRGLNEMPCATAVCIIAAIVTFVKLARLRRLDWSVCARLVATETTLQLLSLLQQLRDARTALRACYVTVHCCAPSPRLGRNCLLVVATRAVRKENLNSGVATTSSYSSSLSLPPLPPRKDALVTGALQHQPHLYPPGVAFSPSRRHVITIGCQQTASGRKRMPEANRELIISRLLLVH